MHLLFHYVQYLAVRKFYSSEFLEDLLKNDLSIKICEYGSKNVIHMLQFIWICIWTNDQLPE